MFIQLIPDFTVNGVTATPGLCYFCRSVKGPLDSGVISTGVDVDQEGLIELHEGCVVEMAAKFGMRTAEQVKTMRENNRQQGFEIKSLKKKLEQYEALAEMIQEAKSE